MANRRDFVFAMYCVVNNYTFLKLSPSLTNGVALNILSADISNAPSFIWYKFDIINKRSDDVFTGKNLDLGTLIPLLPENRENR